MSDKFEKSQDFKYYGEGLANGYCGVSVQHIKAHNNGPVKCILGLEENDVEGQIDLVVACKYLRYIFNFNFFGRLISISYSEKIHSVLISIQWYVIAICTISKACRYLFNYDFYIENDNMVVIHLLEMKRNETNRIELTKILLSNTKPFDILNVESFEFNGSISTWMKF